MINSGMLDVSYIDEYIRGNRINEALNYSDGILLKQGLGLTYDEVQMLKNIWLKLSDRRIESKMVNKS